MMRPSPLSVLLMDITVANQWQFFVTQRKGANRSVTRRWNLDTSFHDDTFCESELFSTKRSFVNTVIKYFSGNKMRIVNSFSITVAGGTNSSSMDKKKPKKITPKVPRGLRSLPAVALSGASDPRSEYSALKAEADRLEQWWSTPRWQHTKRVYSGTQ